MTTNQSLTDVAQAVVAQALGKGAQEVAASAYKERNLELEWRDGALEKISEATTRGVGVSLYVGGRYSSVSTCDLRPEALASFLAGAVAMTRVLAKDPFRALPDPKLYEGQSTLDLQTFDPGYGDVTAPQRRQAAQELEQAAREVPGTEHIVSVTSYVGDSLLESARVHSNGFSGTRKDTSFYAGASVSVKDPDGRRPSSGSFASTRHHGDLPRLADVAREASERTLRRIGARKIPTAVWPMAVDNRVVGGLLGRFLGPLSAASLQQQRSFFAGKLGTQVASPLLDLTDQPHLVKGLGSRKYDGEGLAARPLAIFSAGVVKNAFVDNYYGKKLGLAPTTGGMSNFDWKLGDRSQEQLLAALGEGIFVTGFIGGNSNGTTGDFSLGVEGYRVRKGQLAEPVAELNIAGNHLDFWKKLVAVGNDPYAYSAMRSPTLVFESVQFAGV